MKKYGKEKWEKLGGCIKLKFTPKKFKEQFGIELSCGEYSIKELEVITGIFSAVPVEISEDVEGNYEAVCEQGVEIR
ncbi:hypothetical protein ACR77J_07075 [Tissierella praeacuta]|uniref:hypothetical protein n=1 Tax=Tissierella praeacuta TaxID=43131 RepID=UPI003DA28A0E